MAIAINLLRDKYALSEKDYQRERAYLRYSTVVFVVVTTLTAALGMWSLFLSNRLALVEGEIENGTAELADLTEASAQQIYLKSRLQLITSFLDNRTVEREALQQVFSVNVPGVVITGVGFESDHELLVQLTSENVNSLAKVVELWEQPTEFFTQVVSKGVSRAQEGGYQIQVILTIPRSEV